MQLHPVGAAAAHLGNALALAHALGFRRELLHEEPGLVRVSLDLRR